MEGEELTIMYLQMAGLDYHTASMEQREPFSFSKEQQETILNTLKDSVQGVVLLNTCNRTELYLSSDVPCQPSQWLLQFAKETHPSIESVPFYEKSGIAAARHIIEVACGLHSQVLHEEQIVTQVQQAVGQARQLQTTDAILDTLFRTAVSAGKYALTHISDTEIPVSLAEKAIQMMEQQGFSLSNKTGLVIGNGNMGQLAAQQLMKRGCTVYITLRAHHNSSSIVPFGAIPVPYEKRMQYVAQSDLVISATRSPHYTITAEQLQSIDKKPSYLVDLALPRDIELTCKEISSVHCLDLDDFSDAAEQHQNMQAALQIVAEKYTADFQAWQQYRAAIPHIAVLKELVVANLLRSTTMDAVRTQPDADKVIQAAAERTIDLIMGNMREWITSEQVEHCCQKIASHSRLPQKGVTI